MIYLQMASGLQYEFNQLCKLFSERKIPYDVVTHNRFDKIQYRRGDMLIGTVEFVRGVYFFSTGELIPTKDHFPHSLPSHMKINKISLFVSRLATEKNGYGENFAGMFIKPTAKFLKKFEAKVYENIVDVQQLAEQFRDTDVICHVMVKEEFVKEWRYYVGKGGKILCRYPYLDWSTNLGLSNKESITCREKIAEADNLVESILDKYVELVVDCHKMGMALEGGYCIDAGFVFNRDTRSLIPRLVEVTDGYSFGWYGPDMSDDPERVADYFDVHKCFWERV